jgi:hypothetical protein
LRRPVTPLSTYRFETALGKLLWEVGRSLLQVAYNHLEPDEPQQMPTLLRSGLSDYRRNRKTPTTIATLFGKVTLRRFIYQAVEVGEAGIFPLQIALGITAGQATPALADVVGRLMADLPQQQALAVLRERYGVCWSVGTLRKVTASLAEALSPLRQEAQVEYLVELLRKAAKATKNGRPSLVAGRDGIMIPMRPAWEEASTASITVYDQAGKRWGTTYLGSMPEAGQETMTQQLTQLLTAVLAAWNGRLPRLHYVTDAGHHPQDYFRTVLCRMHHPTTNASLRWSWSVDFFHAAERITVLAEALFGFTPAAKAWGEKQRKILKTKRNGALRVIQAARALRRSRGLKRDRRKFAEALRYLWKYREHMAYAKYKRHRLPIGSGVTEAACKTIFTQRMKLSGMRWENNSGQHVLDLRVIRRGNVWEHVRASWLNRARMPVTCNSTEFATLAVVNR